ncbi:DUF397 domain-containing protein [Streptomyces sp. URMC 126]|uniref:DUF397 domain-containing protein n=1 Tax=Streptomyces sp. URMC 126 TaxID=3423401 RepID=UPI003F1D2CC7
MNKSTRLDPADLTCANWWKSSYTAGNGQCVEVAVISEIRGLAFRDSKDISRPPARVALAAWRVFVDAVRNDTLQ